MNVIKDKLSKVFPLTKTVSDLIQAEASVLAAQKQSTTIYNKFDNKYNSMMKKTIHFQSLDQAIQFSQKTASQITPFHLQTIPNKPFQLNLTSTSTYSLPIQIQQPLMSLKQKLNLNKTSLTHFTESQILQIINCMNILFDRYFQRSVDQIKNKYSVMFLLENIFFTKDGLVKLAVPGVLYTYNNHTAIVVLNQKEKNAFKHESKIKFGIFLIEILTLMDTKNRNFYKCLQQKLSALNFNNYCLQELKIQLLHKFRTTSPQQKLKQTNQKYFNQNQTNHEVLIKSQQQRKFPKIKCLKNLNKLSRYSLANSSNINLQTPFQSARQSLSIERKLLSLHDVAYDKVVQSFQQDQYSYVIDNPLNISPGKKLLFFPQILNNSAFSSPSRIQQYHHSPYSKSPKQILQLSQQFQSEHQNTIKKSIQFQLSLIGNKGHLQQQPNIKVRENDISKKDSLVLDIQEENIAQSKELRISKDEMIDGIYEKYDINEHKQIQHEDNINQLKESNYTQQLKLSNNSFLQRQNSKNMQKSRQNKGSLMENSSLIDLSISDNITNRIFQNGQLPQEDQITSYIEHEDQYGNRYHGYTKNGIKSGKGKIYYIDGGYYDGEWKQNQINGFGKLFYPSNNLAYAGYWKNGCFHGPGLVLNEDISTQQQNQMFDYTDFSNLGKRWISYRGNFDMDMRQGQGQVKISNGDSISGHWESNQLNGQAQYRKRDGTVIKGIWKMNRLQKIIHQANMVS